MYRYDISNCLFEATYENILDECKCTPYFHWAGRKEHNNFCRGPSLLCMNEILLRLGEFNEVMDAKDNSTLSAKKRCLAACENQVHNGPKTFLRVQKNSVFTLVQFHGIHFRKVC